MRTSTITLPAGGLLLLACALLWLWPTTSAVPPMAAVADARPAAPPTAATAAAAASSARLELGDAVATTGMVLVRVRRDDGAPTASMAVLLQRVDGDPRVGVRRAVTDADGSCTFAGVDPGRWRAHCSLIDDSPTAVTTVAAAAIARIELVLQEKLVLRGRVVDAAHIAVPDAELVLGPLALSDHDAAVVGHADHAGAFAIAAGFDPVALGARAAGHGPSRMIVITRADGREPTDIELVLSELGGALRGVVTGTDGVPLEGALVRVGRGRLDAIHAVDGTADPVATQDWTDGSGEFRMTGLSVGQQPITARAADRAPFEGVVTIEAGREIATAIALRRGGAVHGAVRTAHGDAIANCTVSTGTRGALDWSATYTDELGRYVLRGLTPGSMHLLAAHPKYGQTAVAVVVADEADVEQDLVFAGGRVLAGRVLDQRGEPQRVLVRASKHGGGWGMGGITTDPQGRFWIPGVPDAPLRVFLQGRGIVGKEFRGVRAQEQEVRFEVLALPAATATVRGLVVSPDAQPIVGTQVSLYRDEDLGRQARVDFGAVDPRTGVFRFGPVAPGHYQVRIEPPHFPRRVVVADVREYEDLDLGSITVANGGQVRIANWQELLPGAELEVWDATEEWLGDIKGEFSPPLAVGTYWLRVRGVGIAETAQPFSVQSGRTTEVSVATTLGRACRLLLHFVRADAAAWVDVVCTRAGVAEQRAVLRRLVLHDGEEELFDERNLAPGDYSVTVRSGQKTWISRFTIDANGDGDRPQVVEIACGG